VLGRLFSGWFAGRVNGATTAAAFVNVQPEEDETVAESLNHTNGSHESQHRGMPTPAGQSVPPRRLYRVPEVMQLLSMSRSVVYEQIRSGRLRSVTQGRTRLIPARALTDYVNLLVAESQEDYGEPA
jgi:excisionase family DNA binding protein